MNPSIASLRKEYKQKELSENHVHIDPFRQFDVWWEDAVSADIEEVNAMTLATADKKGKPSARIVLLKGYDENGFVFFTNYESRKGIEIALNPQVTLVFFWKELERQIRVDGIAEKLNEKESDDYFFSRPEGSRIGAWASPQSRVIPGRELLEERVKEMKSRFEMEGVSRPPHWGGYLVKPLQIEFWQGRPSRLHDRILYSKVNDAGWKIERLAP